MLRLLPLHPVRATFSDGLNCQHMADLFSLTLFSPLTVRIKSADLLPRGDLSSILLQPFLESCLLLGNISPEFWPLLKIIAIAFDLACLALITVIFRVNKRSSALREAWSKVDVYFPQPLFFLSILLFFFFLVSCPATTTWLNVHSNPS